MNRYQAWTTIVFRLIAFFILTWAVVFTFVYSLMLWYSGVPDQMNVGVYWSYGAWGVAAILLFAASRPLARLICIGVTEKI